LTGNAPTGFFAVERRIYTMNNVVMFIVVLALVLLPGNEAFARLSEAIRAYWPKMSSDAGYIEAHNQLLAEKYVLASAMAVLITAISTTLGLVLLWRQGPTGKFPYWVKPHGILKFVAAGVFVFYLAFIDTSIVSGVAERYSHKVKGVFLNYSGLFYSAVIIGLCGTCIVRLATLCWLRLRNGSELPPNT